MKVVVGKEAADATKRTTEGVYGLIEHTADGWRAVALTVTKTDVSRKTVLLGGIPEREQLQTAFAALCGAKEVIIIRGEDEVSALPLLISRGLGHQGFWIDQLRQNEAVPVPLEFLNDKAFYERMKEPDEVSAYA